MPRNAMGGGGGPVVTSSSPAGMNSSPVMPLGAGSAVISNNNDPCEGSTKDQLFERHLQPVEMPHRLGYLYDQPCVPPEVAQRYAWNPHDRSSNLFVKPDDPFTFHRHPVAQSTDGARGKGGFSSGLHIWEIRWPRPERGTNAVVGVATDKFQLHCEGYRSLVGVCEHSWGWDLGRMRLLHNIGWSPDPDYKSCPRYPVLACPTTEGSGKTCPHAIAIPDVFHVVLNMDAGTLGFAVNGRYLGEAFSGLKGKTLYPVVTCVWGHCEISLKYLNSLDSEYCSYRFLSLLTVKCSECSVHTTHV